MTISKYNDKTEQENYTNLITSKSQIKSNSHYEKRLLRAFLDAKSLRTMSRLIVSKISFSMQHVAKPFTLSCDIVDLR